MDAGASVTRGQGCPVGVELPDKKPTAIRLNRGGLLVDLEGFEPLTSALRTQRSLPTELQARPVTQQNPQQRAPADGVIIAQFPRLVKGFAKKSRAVALQLCFPTTAEGINRRYTNERGAPGQLCP